ncbi:MAG TPA: twin-arginine translocation pathway signal [Xanthobacteraceae bacterium]|nr:twin-arginine translocation pathway signal [Xanthobacteraceae bacterium]
MGNDSDRRWRISTAGGHCLCARSVTAIAALALAGFALCGCSMNNGAGSLLVDPSLYSAYHCNDLTAQSKVLAAREKELRALMERADQGVGGAVISSLAYRSDYETVLSEERLLQRTAVEKKCNATPQFQSDQVIR